MPAGFKWLYLYPFAYLHYIYVCDDNTIPVKGTEEKILTCLLPVISTEPYSYHR